MDHNDAKPTLSLTSMSVADFARPANSVRISGLPGKQRTRVETTAVHEGSEVSPDGAETSDCRRHSSGARFTSSESAAWASPTILAPTLFRNRE